MSDTTAADFEKADIILAKALESFQEQGVNQYIYGMALIEIGVLALVRMDEDESSIIASVRDFINKSHQPVPVPRK